jgi:two-component system, OmpR family, sensor histidine kinase BaeS
MPGGRRPPVVFPARLVVCGNQGCGIPFPGGFRVKLRIQSKMFLAMLAVATVVILCMFLVMRWSFDRGFLRYIHTLDLDRLDAVSERLEAVYAAEGSWRFLQDDPARWRRLLLESLVDRLAEPPPPEPEDGGAAGERMGPHGRGGQGRRGMAPPRFSPTGGGFLRRVALRDAAKRRIAGPVELPDGMAWRSLSYEGKTVGYVGVAPPRIISDVRQLRFVEQQKKAFGLIALAVVVIAALLSVPLARQMVRRIRDLASATHRLASGRFDTRVPPDASDELGQLARDFNTLALTLEKNEQARRQWVADISHELRTPLSVLRGEIEGMQDGVRAATPQTIAALHGEVLKLSRLVNDLYELSLSDLGALTYRRADTDLASLLFDALETFRPEFAARGITVDAGPPPGQPFPLFADPDRMHQLFANLLENSARYTDAGGRLQVRIERRDRTAAVHFEDTGPGVPAAEIEKLFERLYRVEGSRSRATGGAGLGLAICRNIVEAHDGTISAAPSPLGGIRVTVELPLGA